MIADPVRQRIKVKYPGFSSKSFYICIKLYYRLEVHRTKTTKQINHIIKSKEKQTNSIEDN